MTGANATVSLSCLTFGSRILTQHDKKTHPLEQLLNDCHQYLGGFLLGIGTTLYYQLQCNIFANLDVLTSNK